MSAVILDSETTSIKEPEAIEIAWLRLDGMSLFTAQEFEQRYRPSKPISFGAMASHHIMEEDIPTDAPPSGSFRLPVGTEFLIGHNVDFDWEVIGRPDVKRIDTCAFARQMWPDTEHSLGAMMYLLLGRDARTVLREAHSARQDVQNCRTLLRAILNKLGNPPRWSEVWEASERARVPERMPFGKHKDWMIADVPRDYKDWLLRQDDVDPYLAKALRA